MVAIEIQLTWELLYALENDDTFSFWIDLFQLRRSFVVRATLGVFQSVATYLQTPSFSQFERWLIHLWISISSFVRIIIFRIIMIIRLRWQHRDRIRQAWVELVRIDLFLRFLTVTWRRNRPQRKAISLRFDQLSSFMNTLRLRLVIRFVLRVPLHSWEILWFTLNMHILLCLDVLCRIDGHWVLRTILAKIDDDGFGLCFFIESCIDLWLQKLLLLIWYHF